MHVHWYLLQIHILKWQWSYVFSLCVKSNKFSGESLGNVGRRKQSSSSTFTSPHLLATCSSAMALTACPLVCCCDFSTLQPCKVAELCTSHPTFHLFSQVSLLTCLQNRLWLNNTINQSPQYPVQQFKIKIQFWVNSKNSLLWVYFLLPRNSFMLACISLIHAILSIPFWPGVGPGCLVCTCLSSLWVVWTCSSCFRCGQVCTIRWYSSAPLCCHCSENHCLLA